MRHLWLIFLGLCLPSVLYFCGDFWLTCDFLYPRTISCKIMYYLNIHRSGVGLFHVRYKYYFDTFYVSCNIYVVYPAWPLARVLPCCCPNCGLSDGNKYLLWYVQFVSTLFHFPDRTCHIHSVSTLFHFSDSCGHDSRAWARANH